MANKKPKNNITRGYRSTNNKVIEGWTGGEGGPHPPEYSSNYKTILFGYFATNKNGKVPEGWRGGQGPHVPPPYVGPKSSFTRAFYSPNTEAYELGWRGGYGFQKHLDYFKNAIALATILVNNQSKIGRIKQASSTSTNLAKTSKSYIQLRFAIALQTSAIVTRYIRSKLKDVIANYTGVIRNSKRFTGISRVTANSIGYAKVTKITRHFRISIVNLVNLAFEGRIDQFFRKAIAAYTQSVIIVKRSRFTRTAKALQTSLATSLKPFDQYYRSAIATTTNLINSSKTFNRFRKSTITSINIANSYKTIKRIKQALVESTFLIRNAKSYNNFKKAFATRVSLITSKNSNIRSKLITVTRVSLVKSSRTYNARVRAIAINIVKTIKIGRFIRTGSANAINIANSYRINVLFKKAISMVINIARDGKIDRFYRYAIARTTNLVTTTKQSRFIRVAKSTQVGITIATRIVVARRLATANRAMLVKVSKNYGKNIKVIFTGLTKNNKLFRFTRRATAAVINLATTRKFSRFIRVAKVTATNIAFDGKIDQFYRYAIARTTGLIKTTKLSRFNRNANANRINLARTNKRRATSIKTLSTNLSFNIKSHAYRKIAKNIVIFIGKVVSGGKVTHKNASVLQSVSATVTKANNRKKYATATVSYEIGTTKGRTYLRRAIATTVGLVRYGLSLVMNVRSVESAKVEPVNEVNFYVTPNNPDVVGEYTSENDQPGDYSEPVNNLGEDVVPT